MKTLNDLKLTPKDRKKVEAWLREILDMFIEKADGQEGSVFRADFENLDFFYFTNCNDILKDDPEYKAQETNKKIRRRKEYVKLQLLIKTLLGEKVGQKKKCTHCGYEDCYINGVSNGHYIFCPKCKKITLVSYLPTWIQNAVEVYDEVRKLDE